MHKHTQKSCSINSTSSERQKQMPNIDWANFFTLDRHSSNEKEHDVAKIEIWVLKNAKQIMRAICEEKHPDLKPMPSKFCSTSQNAPLKIHSQVQNDKRDRYFQSDQQLKTSWLRSERFTIWVLKSQIDA